MKLFERMNANRVNKVCKGLSVASWWIPIVLFAFHIVYGFVVQPEPLQYPRALLSFTDGLITLLFIYWLFQIIIFIGIGIAIKQEKLPLILILSFCGCISVLMNTALFGYKVRTVIPDTFLWLMLSLQTWIVIRGAHLFNAVKYGFIILSVTVIAFAAMQCDYHFYNAEGWYLWHVFAFTLQKWIRTASVLFTSTWLFLSMKLKLSTN